MVEISAIHSHQDVSLQLSQQQTQSLKKKQSNIQLFKQEVTSHGSPNKQTHDAHGGSKTTFLNKMLKTTKNKRGTKLKSAFHS